MDGPSPIPKQKVCGGLHRQRCAEESSYGREEERQKKEAVRWGEGKKEERRTLRFKNTQDLVARYKTDLRNPMGVAEGNTDLGWSQAFTGEFDDVVDNVFRGSFEP
jgi:hypothetical protein